MSELDPRTAGLNRSLQQQPMAERFVPYAGGDVAVQAAPVIMNVNGTTAPVQPSVESSSSDVRMQQEGVGEVCPAHPQNPAEKLPEQQTPEIAQQIQAVDDDEAEAQRILQERENIMEEHAKQQRAHDKKVVEWTKYYADLRDYMIRYSGHHAGQQTQRGVEEQFALRAAQAAVATAQHIAGYERNAQKERERAMQREREAAKKPVMI